MSIDQYPVILAFTFEFTSGSLVGRTIDDHLGFCRIADADEWVCAVNRAHAAGKLDHKVTRWSFPKS